MCEMYEMFDMCEMYVTSVIEYRLEVEGGIVIVIEKESEIGAAVVVLL